MARWMGEGGGEARVVLVASRQGLVLGRQSAVKVERWGWG